MFGQIMEGEPHIRADASAHALNEHPGDRGISEPTLVLPLDQPKCASASWRLSISLELGGFQVSEEIIFQII